MPETSKSRLGKYELLEEIGNGAEGKIFKARCVEPGAPGAVVGELVALKRLRQTGSDTQSDIFKRTTRILGAMDHPNIVRYKDSFIWRDDELDEEVYCLVTELLEGQTLKELMDRYKSGLPWNRAQPILLPALQALEYAGNHSVIHRDLKPSNIYLTHQGDVKLIDFGIARHQDSGATTSTAGPQGTWDFMACDFVRQTGNFRGDQQSDIFSFGVCFYQLLTGVLPYPPLGSNAQMAYFQRCMAPEKLPKVKYSHPIFNVLRGARACVEKCLAFEREARYHTFTEVLADFKLIQRRKLQHGDGEQYEYLEYIGKGGFGRVFRARRMSDGLEVAVKEVLADRNATRFVREAKMLRIMQHPHLVQYLDFVEVSEHGMGEERRLFLVLEYLLGMPQAGLNDRIKTAPSGLDPFEVLPIFSAYLDCLEYLHRNKIIHRDIKPGNLYAPVNAPERAKLFDLGIAHDTEGTKTHGQVPGTLDYMPYEFASQGGERGSAQSDIYSIGVTLYQALTGKLPFDRLPSDEKMAWISWYERCEKPPEIPFNHSVFNTYPELEMLLRRALAFRPQDRYDSAGAMRHEIRAILENWDRAKRKEAYEKALAGARTAFGKREYDEAARHVRIALEVWPEGVEAGQLLGRIETERQRKIQYDTAMTAAKEALERDDLDAAARHVRIALEAWPEGVEARRFFDQIETERQRRTQYDTAITAARKALEQRDYENAQSQADEALRVRPKDSTAQELRSRAEEGMRDREDDEPKTAATVLEPPPDDEPKTAATALEPPPDIEPEPAITREPLSNQPEPTLAPVPTMEPAPPPPVEPPKRRKKSKVLILLPIAVCIIVAIAIVVRQMQPVAPPVAPLKTNAPPRVVSIPSEPSNKAVTVSPLETNQTNIVQVQKPPALVLYGESIITHDISDPNPIRLACLARNSNGLDFVSSNLGLLPNANISFKPADGAAGETNGWILLQPRRGYTGEADVVITAAGKELLPTNNTVHLKIVGEPTPPRLATVPGDFVLKRGGETNIAVRVGSDYFAPGELLLINKTNDPPNVLVTGIQRKGDGFALHIQALRQPQPGKVAIELLLEAPNGTFAPKVFFVTILQPPRITGPATNMIRSTGERTQPIHFAVTGSSPPLSFEGGFGPELLRKYDLQWKINNPAGTNLAITLTVKPPQDFQGTETFTAIAGDAAGQQVTNEFIFQFALRENIWVNSIGMTLAWVANLPGCENSQWMNRANGGWVGRCEVTQDEFTQVLHTNPSKSRAAGNGKFPVESMSVEEATRFCEELTRLDGRLLPAGWHYALPTEEQWEFFAAGTPAMDTKFAYFAPARIKKPTMPQEVGRLATNAFGLYDVLGNVAELTSTLWHYTTNADEMKLYICRGGGFHSTSTQITPNREDVVDKASWHFYGPAYDIGFRVILIPR